MLKINKLKSKIIEKETTVEALSSKIGISSSTFYRKMEKDTFYLKEVHAIARELQLTLEEIADIFFAH